MTTFACPPPPRRYSFAITAWEVLTRERPFPGMVPMQILMQVCMQGARPAVPDAPAMSDVIELIKRCWTHEPSERPDFEELTDALKVRANDGAFSAPTGARAPSQAPMAAAAASKSFCTECGAPAPREGAKFCGTCGTKFA